VAISHLSLPLVACQAIDRADELGDPRGLKLVPLTPKHMPLGFVIDFKVTKDAEHDEDDTEWTARMDDDVADMLASLKFDLRVKMDPTR
jgi:hypothetical protein